jgi:Peptidase S24-like
MASLIAVAARLASPPYSVTFTAHGKSMTPLIRDRQVVTVTKLDDPEALQAGDVVLARVGRQFYLHKVTVNDRDKRRVQIGNNRGYINGWASYANVYGICYL